MAGSRKGERRGNARKRPAKPPGWKRTHETPGEIMREAVSRPQRSNETYAIERRIHISRCINGISGRAEDVTPKEALLLGMQHNLQAFFDWRDMLIEIAKQDPTPENTLAVERCEVECGIYLDKMRDFARDVAGFIHPKLVAEHSTVHIGDNQASILHELLDEINELERSAPIPIEYKPMKTGGG